MKRFFVLSGILCFMTLVIFPFRDIPVCCATGDVIWDKTFGGIYSDGASSVRQTLDGGYIIAGNTDSSGPTGTYPTNAWILRLDSSGNLLWDKTYGGTDGDWTSSIQETIDGGYIVSGWTYSKGAGSSDAWVFKLDSSGNLLWDKTYGGTFGEAASSIEQTSDEGYIVAGWTTSKGAGSSDAWVFKLDSSGNLLWDKTYGGTDGDGADSIQQTSDGGYIVSGFTTSKGADSPDAWIFKLDSSGNLLWDKTYGGTQYDRAWSIQQTSDSGYIVAGYTNSKGAGSYDIWVLRLDSSGNLLWDKTYGGTNDDVFYGTDSIQQTSDGGYIVAGWTYSKGAGSHDIWVLKLDSTGNLIWDRTYGGINEDGATSVRQTSDGNFIVAGYTTSKGAGGFDAWVLKLAGEETLITLTSFTATPFTRKIILSWTTASEIDNAGFNLYRAEAEDGEYVKINDSLIPAEGSVTQGAEYQFVDENVKNRKTYYYKLEDIDINGTTTMHGPVSATPRRVNELRVKE